MSTSNFLQKMHSLVTTRVQKAKAQMTSEQLLRELPKRRPLAFAEALQQTRGPALITEIKRKSPSRGDIAMELDPLQVAKAYAQAGTHAISVLTEPHYFAGNTQDLLTIRSALPHMPLLMKDFIIDPYQILQAQHCGADAVLLIHSLIGPECLQQLLQFAQSLGLSALVEVHDQYELDSAVELGASLIGINNRNLKTLQIDMRTTTNLLRSDLPKELVLVAESGIF